jgi:hypothetical protein
MPCTRVQRVASRRDAVRPTANLRQQLQSTRSRPWSRITGACARSRRATGASSTWSATQCWSSMRSAIACWRPIPAAMSCSVPVRARASSASPFPRGFDEAASAPSGVAREIRSVGRGQLHNLLLADGETRVDLSASFLRQGGEERYLLRLASGRRASRAAGTAALYLQEVLRAAPDAVLLPTRTAASWPSTQSFLVPGAAGGGGAGDRALRRSLAGAQRRGPERAALQSAREVRGQAVLIDADARRAGSPRRWRFPPAGSRSPTAGLCPVYPRCRAPRGREHPVAAKLPSSIEQVTQRVGRVPLKELVRESTDLIEALCIETALEVTRTTARPPPSCWVSAASPCTPSCGASISAADVEEAPPSSYRPLRVIRPVLPLDLPQEPKSRQKASI